MSLSDEDDQVIPCVAVDGKIHMCLPWEKVTACTEKLRIISKNVTEHDYVNRLNCYECSY